MIDRKILFGLSVVLLATCYDLTRSYLNSASTETKSDESTSSSTHEHSNNLYDSPSVVPPPKMKKQTTQAIKFLYCNS
jgi:hypothetical protein